MKRIRDFWNKVICFFFGHKPWKYSYRTESRICLNRKGGKKRGKGVYKRYNKHYRIYCKRCWELLDKE